MGRPTKQDKELRSRNMKYRVTEREYEKIKKKAEHANKSVSAYSREMLLKGVVVQTNTKTPRLLSHLGRVGNNLNQIAIRVNKAGSIRLNMREFRIIEEMRNLLRQIADEIAK